MTTDSDRVSGWNWRRPWLCADCHPGWFFGSAVLYGTVFCGLVFGVAYEIAVWLR